MLQTTVRGINYIGSGYEIFEFQLNIMKQSNQQEINQMCFKYNIVKSSGNI